MKEQTPTIHNAARYGEIAKTVLMPGDPLRAKYIAEKFLDNPRLVSDIRNIYCYTGTWQGREVSVMASGMGAGSMSIYSYELFHFYDVDAIIRVGSAGGMHPSLKLRDVVVALASSTDNGYARHFNLPGDLAPLRRLQPCGRRGGLRQGPRHVGPGGPGGVRRGLLLLRRVDEEVDGHGHAGGGDGVGGPVYERHGGGQAGGGPVHHLRPDVQRHCLHASGAAGEL